MMLYGIDVSGTDPELAIDRFMGSFGTGEDLDPPPPWVTREERGPKTIVLPEARDYATELVRGVCANQVGLDERIRKVSAHWRLERMALVDRNILRLGAFELIHLSEEVPRKVVINEAVEIAKTFSTGESSAFINGILDRVQPSEATA